MMQLATRLCGALLLLGGSTVGAQETVPAAKSATSAEVRIQLPASEPRGVAVEPHDGHIVIDLPRGSMFPMDFQATTGGLVREGSVKPLGDDRVRVELAMAAGYLARVEFEAGELVLTFESRFGTPDDKAPEEDKYLLGEDDKIIATVYGHPELTTTFVISRHGTITAPMLGEIQAAGLSPTELAERLADLLGRSFLVDPQVDVAVEQYNSQWVMVTGEVPLAGRLPLRGGTRLKEVLSEAGGFRETSGDKITISRKSDDSEDYTTITIQRHDFESGARNPVLRHGDIVEVGRAEFCYIHGEVRAPGRVPIERSTTLLKALSMVGGLTEWADRKQVRILYGEDHEPREMRVNVRRIQDGKDPDPQLGGGEVIVVKRRFF